MQSGYEHMIWTSSMLQVNATSITQNIKPKGEKTNKTLGNVSMKIIKF